mgnify:CR=1 FL=1
MNPLVAPEPGRHDGRTALSVNVNKIALLRNTRHLGIPDVVALSRIALEAGAQGITVHPRPDERHIRAADVRELHALRPDAHELRRCRILPGQASRRRCMDSNTVSCSPRRTRRSFSAVVQRALMGHCMDALRL